MKRIFITGESGTIPMQMQRIASEFDFQVINSQLLENELSSLKKHKSFEVRKPELDFLHRNLFLNRLENMWKNVDLVIHSGAFVGTDFCSSDPTMAIRTNVEGTQNIVDICNKYKIPLIYMSTTAILDPKHYSNNKPMTEFTSINPQTIYGISKYAGELIVQNTCLTKRMVLRPVFGFGNYPDDLHSALTKVIYVIYRNLKGKDTSLTVLLDTLIPKSYTRVENIANCILSFARNLLENNKQLSEFTICNIGENHYKSKDWIQLLDLIAQSFAYKLNCNSYEVRDIFKKKITFLPDKDYLHYHNMDDTFLSKFGLEFSSSKNYIPIDRGISMTLSSVIENIEQEPYWL